MKTINTIEQVRKDYKTINRTVNGLTAVITHYPFTKKQSKYGVQFWTEENIGKGAYTNEDGSTFTFVERL